MKRKLVNLSVLVYICIVFALGVVHSTHFPAFLHSLIVNVFAVFQL